MSFNFRENELNDTQEAYSLNVDMQNLFRTVREDIKNHEIIIEKPKTVHFNDGKTSDVIDVSDDYLKDVQCQKAVQYNIEGDGRLLSNHEYETQILETNEKGLDGLKIKDDQITDKVQMITGRNKLSKDQITMIKAETNKIQNEFENMHEERIVTCNKLENTVYLKEIVEKMEETHGHIDQFTVVLNGLKPVIEEACNNGESMVELMEVSEYLRAQYDLQVTKNQRHITEQINKNVREIEQLKAYVDTKNKQADLLEKRVKEQKLCIDSHEKSNKYITDKLSKLFTCTNELPSENRQLAVPDEKQRQVFCLLSSYLEEMDQLLEKAKKEDMNMDYNMTNLKDNFDE